jgi:LacI family transcriptional regulator
MDPMTSLARATRDDVAKKAGVSTAVVSYVVNNGPRPVASATRDRVLAAMAELEYRPNASARALKLARTGVLGLVVPDISNPFFSEFAKHVQDIAHEQGYAVIVGNTNLDPEREQAQLTSILDREVDGLIVFGIRDATLLSTLVTTRVPVVSMDWQLQDGTVPTVVADDYGAALAAVQHLVGHGHTDIGYIGGPDDLRISHVREQGWADVVGPLVSSDRLLELRTFAEFSRRGGHAAGLTLLSGAPRRPTALFVSSDIQAIGVLHACYILGLDVPGDLAVVSFDGTEDSEFSSPPMTTVQLPLELMAGHAVRKLLESSPGLDLHSTIPHRLIVRDSCGCERPAAPGGRR